MTQTNTCPECGKELPLSAPRGLCPACLLRRGLEANTVPETAPTAGWAPPSPEELGASFPESEIQRLIGRGGMGAVYQARQKSLDRTVALKILPPAMATDPAFADRFAREAQAMARLNHPHIVTIYEFGEQSGLYFFLMEYVDGVSLRHLLDSGHVSPKEALAIVPQICEALQYAHDQGIVHRDIKPENILLSKSGQVKIADFGLAKLMGVAGGAPAARPSSTAARNETIAGSVMGTPQYMAPEQKDRPAEVDHRADIYSLGVVFYQMLTGELPKGSFEPPSRKVRIDVRLDEIVLKALEREPERRYQHASEVKTEVETLTAAHALVPDNASLSRTAIVACAWIGLFLAVVPAFLAHEAQTHEFSNHGPMASPLGALVSFGIVIPAFLAPVGATILGWIAVAQIRRSGGRLYGMPLAVAAGLAFPLVFLGAAIAALASIAIYILRQQDSLPPKLGLLILVPILVIAVGAIIDIDLRIIRRVWRAVNKPLAGANPTQQASSSVETTPAAAPEGVTVSAWCRIVSLLLGTTFTSRLAVRLINISALGFLGFLAALAAMPLPGMHRFLGFSGFFGFFGLIGFAVIVEMAVQRKARKSSDQHETRFGAGRPFLLVLGGAVLTLVAGLAIWRVSTYTPPVNGSAVALPARSPYPISSSLKRNGRSVYIVDDAVDLHYALFYAGECNSAAAGSHNTHSLTWIDKGSIRLKNGRTFGYLRESVNEFSLDLNGREFDLRQGRVLVLNDDGTVEQIRLFPALSAANDVDGLAAMIASAKALYEEPADMQKLQGRLSIAQAQLNDLLKTHAPTHERVLSVRKEIATLGQQMVEWRRSQAGQLNQASGNETVFRTDRGDLFATGAIPGFTQLHERTLEVSVLRLGDARLKNCWINFESAEVLSYPEGMERAPFAEAEAKLYEQGAAAVCVESKGGPVLKDAGGQCRFMPLSPSDQRIVNAVDLAELWRAGVSSETTEYGSWDQLPRAFMFKLRNGRMGILQIAEATHSPRGLTVRYRLTTKPSTQPTPGLMPAKADTRELLLQRREAMSLANALQKEADAKRLEGKTADAMIALEQRKAALAQVDLLTAQLDNLAGKAPAPAPEGR